SAFETVFHDVIEGLRPKVGFEIDGRLFRKFSAVSSEIDIMEKRGRTREYALLKKAGISKEDYEKSIKPTQAFYAILDHARTLLFAITDGALPSNIGGGYNLRIILRRALGFIDEYGLKFDLDEVAALEAEELKRLFPELSDSMGLFSKVIDIEKGRFARTKENAGRIIEGMLSKSKSIDAKRLRTLYESNGITPDLIENTAARKGIKVDMPESSYEDILKGDFVAKEKGKGIDMDVHGIDKTEQLYYKLAEESESNVLKSEKNYLVLDRTPFYPEGGGQEADNGTINGHKVEDVQRVGDVIVHIMKENIDGKKDVHPGSKVHCIVDRERRRRLMVHHTSTHLMSAAARSVLGKHAWQEGTRKSFDKAHIDVAHYDKLGSEDVRMLEQFVNSKLFGGIKVTVKYMDRKDAEGKYGFEIYQGHGVPSHTMRMVIIEGMDGGFIDAEACGGLHVAGMEQAIGMIKIIDTERISDGVDRIVFVAGDAALDYFRNVSNVLSDAALKLNTEQSRVVERIELIGEENRKARKQMQEYKEAMAENIATSIASSSETETEIDLPKDVLRLIATKAVGINASAVVLLCNKAGEAVCITGDKSVVSALDFIKSRAKGFTGGGNKKFAEGKIA
ncbi:alanine--tRNA ligase-related protein, partial [Candidatus Marsarchaeota archaeon]|nr:alanine--tRNA ligase-related protein [Candidatus Marsarchaeota archaeon]